MTDPVDWFDRTARELEEGFDRVGKETEELGRALDALPATVFRCDRCSRIADSTERANPGRPLKCRKHGMLRELPAAEWLAEWRRRGRPARMNLRIAPMC